MKRDDESSGDLFGWVTDFDNPEVAAPRDKPSASRPEQLATRMAKSKPALVAGAASLVAVATIVIAALARPLEEDAGTRPGGVDGVAPFPIPTAPTTSATAKPNGSDRLPETCEDVYTLDMKRALAESGLEVNSAWTGSRNLPAGSADEELLRLLADHDTLDCFWLDKHGGEDSALLTVLIETTEATAQSAMARLTELGLTRREEHGGVRYFFETRTASNELHGESHFFRDGLWLATRWYGVGQFGYTADMAQSVFG